MYNTIIRSISESYRALVFTSQAPLRHSRPETHVSDSSLNMLQQFLLTLAAFTALSLSSAIPNTNQLNKRSFSNGPVITENFPDPSIINVDGKWYSFATNNGNSPSSFHVQIAESDDFTTWNYINQDAMPDMSNAMWSNGQNVWAPDVSQIVSLVHPM